MALESKNTEVFRKSINIPIAKPKKPRSPENARPVTLKRNCIIGSFGKSRREKSGATRISRTERGCALQQGARLSIH